MNSERDMGCDRLYRALAFFDSRDGTFEARVAQAAREGYEREAMGEDRAWGELDTLFARHEAAMSEPKLTVGRSEQSGAVTQTPGHRGHPRSDLGAIERAEETRNLRTRSGKPPAPECSR